MEEEKIVISLGGSLIVPEEINVSFLKNFRELILSHVKRGKKFLITTGGGKTCRKYQEASRLLAEPSDDDLDWIGIASLRLNAELLRVIFGKDAHYEVVSDLSKDLSFEKPVVVGSAYKPGQSSDWNAVLGAKTIGAKKIINLSNTDYIYDSDPKKNPNAKKIEKISWADYRKLIPKEWKPGMNSPFDPVASELAEKEGISVVALNGRPIDNLANCLDGKEFKGSVIEKDS